MTIPNYLIHDFQDIKVVNGTSYKSPTTFLGEIENELQQKCYWRSSV